jgi:hypothetical protein
MEDKYFIEDPDSAYHEGVLLDEYQGKYSLVSARKGKNGKVYMSWCFPQGPDRKPREKGVPWKVTLGDKAAAKKALLMFADILDGGKGEADNIPF